MLILEKYTQQQIDQSLDEINNYFFNYIELEVDFQIETLNELVEQYEGTFDLDAITTLICNLEDEDTMQELIDGDIDTFDPWDESQFNDSYWDMADQLGIGADEDEESDCADGPYGRIE